MQNKILYLFSLLFLYSVSSYSQNHERNSEARAQGIVDQICERILIPSEKKDSFVMAFKSYFDDVHIYKDKGEKMMHALEVARDTDIRRVLTNDDQYLVYQKFMKELAEQRAKNKSGQGAHHGGHHGGNH